MAKNPLGFKLLEDYDVDFAEAIDKEPVDGPVEPKPKKEYKKREKLADVSLPEPVEETGPKPPKFVYEDWFNQYGYRKDATDDEILAWFAQEKEYWKTGRFDLYPAHYFFLTQCMIKDALGELQRPAWRDVDELIYRDYHYALENRMDLMVTKRREVGLSLTFGGVIPLWAALVNKGSTQLITSADKARMEEMYKEKTRVAFNNLHPVLLEEIGIVSGRQAGYLHLGKEEPGMKGVIKGLDSKILSVDTVDKPSAFEAYRATSIFIDEFFLHPKADKVYKSSQASAKKGFVKVCPVVMGGSASETSIAGLKKGIELWKDAAKLRLLTLFLPGWMGISQAPELDEKGEETGKILNFCVNGWSDEKAATEWIMTTRARLDELEDKSHLESFIKQYPIKIEEVFSATNQSRLPKDVIASLIRQQNSILASPPPIERCDLSRDANDNIVRTPNKSGKIYILENPIEGRQYIAGTDPIPFTSDGLGDGSDYAIVIKDRQTQRYVAYYCEKSADANLIMDNTIMLQDYFFKAVTMVEMNRGGVVKDKYKSRGRMDLIALSPGQLGKSFRNSASSYGWHSNGPSAERANEFIIDYLRQYYGEIWFERAINEAFLYLNDNTDLLDAMKSCEVYERNITEKFKKHAGQQKKTTIRIPMLTTDAQGRAIMEMREYNV